MAGRGRRRQHRHAAALHLCLPSVALFCGGAVFIKAITRLGVRLMKQVLEECGKKDGNRGKEEPWTPCAIAAEANAAGTV